MVAMFLSDSSINIYFLTNLFLSEQLKNMFYMECDSNLYVCYIITAKQEKDRINFLHK